MLRILIHGAPCGATAGLHETGHHYECRTTTSCFDGRTICTRIETLNAIAGDNVDG
ncbi:MAG: hypothetical protein AAB476_03080 [Patescibacteria group bacterium]